MQYVSLCKNRRTLHTRLSLGILDVCPCSELTQLPPANSDGLISFTQGKTPWKHNEGLELCLCTVDVSNNYLLVSHGVGWRILIHEKAVTGAHSKTAEGHSEGDTPIWEFREREIQTYYILSARQIISLAQHYLKGPLDHIIPFGKIM